MTSRLLELAFIRDDNKNVYVVAGGKKKKRSPTTL